MQTRPAEVVADGVVRIEVPLPLPEPDRINCYALLAERLLVDTGMRGSEQAIDAGLERYGAPVDRVLITHGHPDHWGLASRFSPAVLGHPDVLAQMRFADAPRREAIGMPDGWVLDDAYVELLAPWRPYVEAVPEIDGVADGDRIGEWEVLVTPGHAPGHVCLYRERDGVLIAGDNLLPTITPNIHLTEEMPDAVADYLASLERISRLDVSLVLPSHGEPFEDCRGRAAELVEHHRRRLARLESALAGGPAETATLAAQLFRGARQPADRLLAEMETYAHLEHLRLQGRVGVERGLWAVRAPA